MELTIVLGAILLVSHFGFGAWLGYYRYEWFGGITHFLGGLFLGALTGSLLWSFIIACLWEDFEFLFDWYFPQYSDKVCWYSRSVSGAIKDVAWTTLGAWILL